MRALRQFGNDFIWIVISFVCLVGSLSTAAVASVASPILGIAIAIIGLILTFKAANRIGKPVL